MQALRTLFTPAGTPTQTESSGLYKRPRASLGSGYPGKGYTKVPPARVPSRIPGGDSSFPNGGPFGVAQKKSTSYDSGGDPTGTRLYPQSPESCLLRGILPGVLRQRLLV